jgi:hypothetical protein
VAAAAALHRLHSVGSGDIETAASQQQQQQQQQTQQQQQQPSQQQDPPINFEAAGSRVFVVRRKLVKVGGNGGEVLHRWYCSWSCRGMVALLPHAA